MSRPNFNANVNTNFNVNVNANPIDDDDDDDGTQWRVVLHEMKLDTATNHGSLSGSICLQGDISSCCITTIV